MKPAENFVISVADHDGPQGEPHHEECEGLKAIEVAQGVFPPVEEHTDYSRELMEGSGVTSDVGAEAGLSETSHQYFERSAAA
jgi:hypothetical protein